MGELLPSCLKTRHGVGLADTGRAGRGHRTAYQCPARRLPSLSLTQYACRCPADVNDQLPENMQHDGEVLNVHLCSLW